MLPRDWIARFGTHRVDRRLAGSGLLGAALLALLGDTQPAEARRRKRTAKSKKQSKRSQSEKERTRRTPRFCGGIAGIPCPDGFACVDDPGDDCDPDQGGADCGGICVRRIKDVCATVRCRRGTHCCPDCGRRVCVPDSVSCQEACTSTPCNEATCGRGEYCCNESCSRCAKLGQGCTREICPPKDPGGEPCGRNRCDPGEYCCNPSCGVCAPLNGGCAAVYCPPEPEPWPEPEPGPGGDRCGTIVCPRGEYCCNASCSICAPPNAACLMIACVEEIAE